VTPAVEESFKVLVTVTGVEGNCGEVKITVGKKSDTLSCAKKMKDYLKNKEKIH
jgi:hypothetical protein